MIGFQDLMSIPPPTAEASNFWPLAMALLSLVVAAVSAGFAAWVKIREKKVDGDLKASAERQRIEIEQLKLQFEQRKEMMDTLSEEYKFALEEGRRLRAELDVAMKGITSRDEVIAGLRGDITSLRKRIATLEEKS